MISVVRFFIVVCFVVKIRQKRNQMKFFLCVLGMVMIVEGLPYFAFPEKMKSWVQKMLEMPDSTLRKFGFVLMLTGLWMIYMGKG